MTCTALYAPHCIREPSRSEGQYADFQGCTVLRDACAQVNMEGLSTTLGVVVAVSQAQLGGDRTAYTEYKALLAGLQAILGAHRTVRVYAADTHAHVSSPYSRMLSLVIPPTLRPAPPVSSPVCVHCNQQGLSYDEYVNTLFVFACMQEGDLSEFFPPPESAKTDLDFAVELFTAGALPTEGKTHVSDRRRRSPMGIAHMRSVSRMPLANRTHAARLSCTLLHM